MISNAKEIKKERKKEIYLYPHTPLKGVKKVNSVRLCSTIYKKLMSKNYTPDGSPIHYGKPFSTYENPARRCKA